LLLVVMVLVLVLLLLVLLLLLLQFTDNQYTDATAYNCALVGQ
jgi:hypothetical protein